MSVYTPTPVELGDITLLDDGDAFDAGGLNTPVEAIADGVAYLMVNTINGWKSKPFTASGTWTAPANCRPIIFLDGFGGGGCGGDGSAASTATTSSTSGGGGGGGSLRALQPLTITPGATYTIAIGPGGARVSPTGFTAPDGGDTTFSDSVPTVLARFPGAGGGAHGVQSGAPTTAIATALGGPPVRPVAVGGLSASAPSGVMPNPGASVSIASPSSGGRSLSTPATAGGEINQPGGGSAQGFNGGAGGATGAGTASPRYGGGGGGGGGAGAGGNGGGGGAGGAASGGGTGGNGSAGTGAAANTGAGGGGGGGGGSATTTPGTGGNGGNGGSGKLVIYYFGDAT